MPKSLPTFARCTLFVPDLALLDAFPVGEPTDVTAMNVVVDLEGEWDLNRSDEAIGRVKHPKGVSLKTEWRFDRRIILNARIPTGAATAGEAARLLGRIADALFLQT